MRFQALIIAMMLVSACSRSPSEGLDVPSVTAENEVPPIPDLDLALVTRGAELYAENCVVCHQADLSGDPDWKTPAKDGGFRPPPHDSTGHTWHHADDVLAAIVLTGYDFPVPESRMPQFAGTLTEDDVRAILEFIKTSWGPDERAYQWEQTVRDGASS